MRAAYLSLLILLTGFLPPRAFASLTDCLSQPQFHQLAGELAPKVNLFAKAWAADPRAEFFGGTTRDYLYWLKGKFVDCRNPEEGAKIAAFLRAEPVIDVRDFIIGDSDIDIVSGQNLGLDPGQFGVTKIDRLSPEIFDPDSPRGQNEMHQGHIPAEKVRLGREGFHPPGAFGDGLGEIYSGRLTVHFTSPEEFAKGSYAAKKLNHPILLALRYQRLLGINYFKTYGAGLPDPRKLFNIDPASDKAVKEVVQEASKGGALSEYLSQDSFRKWMNGALQKSFRSYTNPTAARDLLKHFGVDEVAKQYGEIDPLNQYVFQKYHDEKAVNKNLEGFGTTRGALYTPAAEIFPDGYLYHGTKTDSNFRGVLFQGFLPSTSGSAGAGLYGVAESHKDFAVSWAGSPDRLLKIPVVPTARIVDITQGEGARLWKEFSRTSVLPDYEIFADRVGADILKYPYHTEAFVVKNSASLGRPEGVNSKIMTISEARRLAGAVENPAAFWELAAAMNVSRFDEKEKDAILSNLKVPVQEMFRSWSQDPQSARTALEFLADEKSPLRGFMTQNLKPNFFEDALAHLDSSSDFSLLSRAWPLNSAPTKEAMAAALARVVHAEPKWNEVASIDDLIATKQLAGDLKRPEFLGAVQEKFNPILVETLKKISTREDAERIANKLRLTKESLLRPEDAKAIAESWEKSGVVAALAYPGLKDQEMSDLFSLILDTNTPLHEALRPKIMAVLREQARTLPHLPKMAETFGDQVPTTATLRRAYVYFLLRTPKTDAEIIREMSLGYWVFNDPDLKIADVYEKYLKSPEGLQDKTLWNRLLEASPKRKMVSELVSTVLSDPESPLANELKNDQTLKAVMAKVQHGKRNFPSGELLRSSLDSLQGRNPALYSEVMKNFLEEIPGLEKIQKNNPYANYDWQRERINVESILLPKRSGDPVLKSPAFTAEFGNFLENSLVHSTRDRPVQEAARLLSFPEVASLPNSTAWMSQLLLHEQDADALRRAKLDPILKEVLGAEPWKSHPLRAAWVSALELPTKQTKTFLLLWSKRRAPRQSYMKVREKFVFAKDARIEKWQKEIRDDAPTAVLSIGEDKPYTLTTCPTFFQRAFLLGGKL